ncbi:MAG TPA: nitroreductase family deazaflavin-dependent oxidoreductase [Candidatus Dormibacteraeota bacterium]|nr:nitroreductase family deazaflavin-dependent oxidoreductase [Candidatus Dormibacteraeota bacterium]
MAAQPRIPAFVRIFDPLAGRLLRMGARLGPNALLTVPGRRTGELRTTPVALVEVGGRRWIAGTFGDVNWVRNLRAAGKGTITVGGRTERLQAVELSRGEAESFFADILGPYVRRSPFAGWMLRSLLHARDVIDDPHEAAERHPVFELHATEA